jgi:hypothetical protein
VIDAEKATCPVSWMCALLGVPRSSFYAWRHRAETAAALYRAVIVRMQHNEPTRAYVTRRTAEGKTKAEIIRCLKRLLARETWALMRPLRSHATTPPTAT